MTSLNGFMTSRLTHFASGAILSAIWLLFAIAHLSIFLATGRVSLLFFCIAESAIAAFLLLRTQPKTFSTRWTEWFAAMIGTFLPLLLRPVADEPSLVAEFGLTIGAAILIAAALSLNRSFAMVPALRQLKTNGMYRIVRHPIYFSYLVTFSFYLAANFSARNLVIVLASLAMLVARIHFEERHLAREPEYRAYRSRVRWRLIPFVF